MKKIFKKLRMICKNFMIRRMRLERSISSINLNLKFKRKRFTIQNGSKNKRLNLLKERNRNWKELKPKSKHFSTDQTHTKKKLILASI